MRKQFFGNVISAFKRLSAISLSQLYLHSGLLFLRSHPYFLRSGIFTRCRSCKPRSFAVHLIKS